MNFFRLLNQHQAAGKTHPSWTHRCGQIRHDVSLARTPLSIIEPVFNRSGGPINYQYSPAGLREKWICQDWDMLTNRDVRSYRRDVNAI